MALSMEKWRGKVVVVTGASAGIGAAIAEELVEAGLKVVGLARRKERVEELAKKLEGKNGKLYAVCADMTKEEDILKAFEWTKNNVGPINILINNAGVARMSTLMEGNTKAWKDILDTNVLSLCIATREAVKDMRANNIDGHIVHINSIAGHIVPNTPVMNVYPASKHAVRALTETLRQELNSINSKIKISSVSPGYVDTEIFEATAKASGVSSLPMDVPEITAMLRSKDVSDAVMYILSTPAHVQVHELMLSAVP